MLSMKYPDLKDGDVSDNVYFYEIKFWYKDKLQREEFMYNNNETRIVLTQYKKKQRIKLQNKDGKKEAIFNKLNHKSIIKLIRNVYDFKYSDERKTICGLECFKAEYKKKDDDRKYYVYYANEMEYTHHITILNEFVGLIGFPVEHNGYTGDLEFIMSLTEFGFEDIDDSLFEIPEEYEKVYKNKNS